MDADLTRFVDHARDRGMDPGTIRRLLVAAGWPERSVAEAICAHDLELSIPVPPRADATPAPGRRRTASPWPRRAREAFLHLLVFGALFTWVGNVTFIVFSCINFALPDPAWRVSQAMADETMSAMRGALASLVVAFPVFLFLWHYLLREVRDDPEKGRGAIRRWLAYLTLFAGALTITGDIMTLIYFLLEGQLTLRLVAKAAFLFLVAGSVVAYLALCLRNESEAAK